MHQYVDGSIQKNTEKAGMKASSYIFLLLLNVDIFNQPQT